jgi:ankyrin repeat protein
MVRAKPASLFTQVLSDMRHDSKALEQHLSARGFTDPEKIREHTTTLLHIACVNEALRKPESVVQQLIEAGADPNMAQTGTGVTALMLTTSAETASCLLDNGADVNNQTEDGLIVLHFAALGHLALVDMLLRRGAQEQILERNASGETPFSTAVYGGHVEVALLMLEQLLVRPGFDINHPRLGANQPLLCAAAKAGILRVVDLALNHGADVNATGPDGPALLQAVQHGHLDVVSLLCERGAAVHMRWGNGDSFSEAVIYGNVPIIKKLISYGGDVNAVCCGYPMLVHAVRKADPAVVTLLLKAGAAFHTELQFDCLAVASEKLDDAAAVKVVKALLPYCNLRAVSPLSGAPALLYAVQNGQLQTARALRTAGASVLQCGSALMQSAAEYGHLALVKWLHSLGLDPRAESSHDDNKKSLPLHWACNFGHLSVVRYLLDLPGAAADVHALCCNGSTPLHKAACSDDENPDAASIVQLLLERGADANANDSSSRGITPLMLAKTAPVTKLLQLLVLMLLLLKRIGCLCCIIKLKQAHLLALSVYC